MLTGIATIWDDLEAIRRSAAAEIDPASRKNLGQILTPVPVARLLAEMFSGWRGSVELIDAGSGAGTVNSTGGRDGSAMMAGQKYQRPTGGVHRATPRGASMPSRTRAIISATHH